MKSRQSDQYASHSFLDLLLGAQHRDRLNTRREGLMHWKTMSVVAKYDIGA